MQISSVTIKNRFAMAPMGPLGTGYGLSANS